MQHLTPRQGDLFETGWHPTEIDTEDRAKLLDLLQELLTEALAVPTTRSKGKNPKETGNDQDHA